MLYKDRRRRDVSLKSYSTIGSGETLICCLRLPDRFAILLKETPSFNQDGKPSIDCKGRSTRMGGIGHVEPVAREATAGDIARHSQGDRKRL